MSSNSIFQNSAQGLDKYLLPIDEHIATKTLSVNLTNFISKVFNIKVGTSVVSDAAPTNLTLPTNLRLNQSIKGYMGGKTNREHDCKNIALENPFDKYRLPRRPREQRRELEARAYTSNAGATQNLTPVSLCSSFSLVSFD